MLWFLNGAAIMSGRSAWMVGILVWLSTAAVQASDTPPDPAKDAEARRMFEDGRAAYEAGQYQDGLNYFQRAYDLSLRPGLLFNIGQAAYKMHSDDRALKAFKAYLAQTPSAPNRVEVEQRIHELEQASGGGTKPTYVFSPEQTAREGGTALWAWPETKDNIDKPPPEPEPITKQWWFWTTIGVIVVGGTVTAIAIAAN